MRTHILRKVCAIQLNATKSKYLVLGGISIDYSLEMITVSSAVISTEMK